MTYVKVTSIKREAIYDPNIKMDGYSRRYECECGWSTIKADRDEADRLADLHYHYDHLGTPRVKWRRVEPGLYEPDVSGLEIWREEYPDGTTTWLVRRLQDGTGEPIYDHPVLRVAKVWAETYIAQQRTKRNGFSYPFAVASY